MDTEQLGASETQHHTLVQNNFDIATVGEITLSVTGTSRARTQNAAITDTVQARTRGTTVHQYTPQTYMKT